MELKEPARSDSGQAWRSGALGYTFAFSIILCAGAGYLLDRWWDTRPYLTIAGTLAGAGLAIARVYLLVRQDASKGPDRQGGGS